MIHTFPCASNLLSLCKSILATLMLPYLAAICKGVKPFLVVALREALFSTRIVATCIHINTLNKTSNEIIISPLKLEATNNNLDAKLLYYI